MIIDKNYKLITEIYKSIDSKKITDNELLAHLKKRKELKKIEDKKLKESVKMIKALQDN